MAFDELADELDAGEPSFVDPPINPDRLELAMRLAEIKSVKALARSLGRHGDTVRNWTKERATPHRSNLQELSRTLSVPVSFLTDPTTLPAVHSTNFRTSSRRIRAMHDRYEAYSALVGALARFLVGSQEAHFPKQTLSPSAAASLTRRRASLADSDPVANVLVLAASQDIVVSFSPKSRAVDAAQIDAYSSWAGSTPVIILNPLKNDYYRQRFDAAHEIGHIVMHRQENSLTLSERESQAHEFASRLLFPRTSGNIRLLGDAISSDGFAPLISLSAKWGISVDALLHAAVSVFQGKQAAVARDRQRAWRATDEPPYLYRAESNDALADAALDFGDSSPVGDPMALIALESGVPLHYVKAALCRTASDATDWPGEDT